ncbi:DUF7282 domain-containing protein [Halobacterium yunchengense]|uniref:DUF7282 domain-containing protein n=1 Tax=Halobacterium yunchengense TaxID=3108497 RepID=UPI0030081E45
MRRPAAAALLAVLLVASAGPVAAHGNHVEADSQYSSDGTVVVEAVRPLADGFLVLHREAPNGSFGEPIGHTAVDVDDGFQRDVPVEMDDDAWADWPANETVWVVYHADDGDGEFDPEDDPPSSAFGRVTGRPVTLAAADRPARVLAERSSPQRTAAGTATVGEVALPADGFLVLRADDDNDTVVGVEALDAGVHESVDVAFDRSAVPTNESTFGLHADVYVDDGDGEFTDRDRRLRAGDSPVSSYFLVWETGDANATTSGPVVNTATSDADVATPTADDPATTERTPTESTRESGSSVPGYGVVHAATALLVAALLLARS